MSFFYTGGKDNYGRQQGDLRVGRVVGLSLGGLVALVLIIFAFSFIGQAYGRYQKRQDAQNQVKVTHILIQKAHQQAEINQAQIAATRAEATKRYVAAIGIKRAQDEIQSTLTPLYVQFEAIEAQKAIATSGQNNTVIYVPAGTNGTPVITNDPLSVARKK